MAVQTISEIEAGKEMVSGYMIRKLFEGPDMDPFELIEIYVDMVREELEEKQDGKSNDV